MSYSISLIGKPDGIKRKLAEYSDSLRGQSKAEFDGVRPALDVILDQQLANGLISVSVSGNVILTRSVKTYGTCDVKVVRLGTQLAE